MTGLREFYRIRYPASERPFLRWGSVRLPVIDLSETGARLSLIDAKLDPLPTLESLPQSVFLQFKDGDDFPTRATVVRIQGQSMAVLFLPTVPFGRILAEQRRLRIRFRHSED